MHAKKILVTGGAGFIGSNLVRGMLKAGYSVRVIDDCSRGSAARLKDVDGQFEFIQGDIRDRDAVINASEGMESICHLAFVNGTEFFYTKPKLVMDVGIRGMLNVLDACEAQGIQELILASSSEVYQTPPMIPTPENVPLSIPDPWNARYSYASSKLISEIMSINYTRDTVENLLIFRPHNVYGSQMGWEHVIPQFICRMKELMQMGNQSIQFPIQGDGTETRAFIHVDDFTDALLLCMKQLNGRELIHIGTQVEVAIQEIACLIAAGLNCDLEILPGPAAKGGTSRRCPDITKLTSLGFNPKISLQDGIKRTIEWYIHPDNKKQ